MSLDQAVERAVDECIREGILAEFLTCNRNEVISMSIFEYDKELEEKKLRKAEYEAGFSEGEKYGIECGTFLNSIETAKRMLKLQEFSLEKIAAITGLPFDEVKKLHSNEARSDSWKLHWFLIHDGTGIAILELTDNGYDVERILL